MGITIIYAKSANKCSFITLSGENLTPVQKSPYNNFAPVNAVFKPFLAQLLPLIRVI